MTIYTFACTVCGHTFEKNVPMTSRNEVPCESCENNTKILLTETSSGCNMISGISRNKKPMWLSDKLKRLRDDSGSLNRMDL